MTAPPPPSGAVIVTGSGSGLGASTAVALAERGYRVVASVHSRDRTAGLDALLARSGAAVEVAELDVTDHAAIPAFVAAAAARHGGLHAVVSNAGVSGVDTFENEDLASYRRTFEVNVFGPVALLKGSLPHLRAGGGRFVAVSSIAGVLGLPFQESYSGSKFALEGVLEAFAPVARRVGVAVSVVEAGPMSTGAARVADWDRVLAGAGPYTKVLRRYLDNAIAWRAELPGMPATQTAAEVAAVIADLLGRDDPPFRCQTAPDTRRLVARKLADLDGAAAGAVTGGWLDPVPFGTVE
ncbi:SDR family NAD(P)-dependent oxidoreductase [Actinomadura parmotrematis]|uniref:SDR family NAD(P)-dependent oxidoreductase n=1 Tax=Actinomadura parmotrematis TaxID=2864039 RepID=A0ABS7FLK9_9ACTN|nr:SDR family NAD(P)-dependent oxidoreductase [Actinomadura parmotrematis]MBW8481263.1 SDR family NAD(P)-dependent oxidoreductase [Actinomadura parmotrematis]